MRAAAPLPAELRERGRPVSREVEGIGARDRPPGHYSVRVGPGTYTLMGPRPDLETRRSRSRTRPRWSATSGCRVRRRGRSRAGSVLAAAGDKRGRRREGRDRREDRGPPALHGDHRCRRAVPGGAGSGPRVHLRQIPTDDSVQNVEPGAEDPEIFISITHGERLGSASRRNGEPAANLEL